MADSAATDLERDLITALNRHSRENVSNTPDYVLARYLMNCLEAYEQAVEGRDHFWDRPSPNLAPQPTNLTHEPMADDPWKKYTRKAIPAEMRPYVPGEDLTGVSIGDDDRRSGSPQPGDMIARDPSNHADQWLVNAGYFRAKFDTTPIE